MVFELFHLQEMNFSFDSFAPNQEGVKLLGWNLPPEHQHLVHPHFKGYPAPVGTFFNLMISDYGVMIELIMFQPYYQHLLFALVYFILLCSSVLGNGIVIWIFST